MLDDRILISATVLDAGDELVVDVVDDRGRHGWAATPNVPLVEEQLERRIRERLGQPVLEENRRWIDRPRAGGPDWVAWSVVENAVQALAGAAEISMCQRLGGSLRAPSAAVDPAELDAPGRIAGDASFDEIAAWLPTAAVGWVSVDPRLWAIPAIVRLDALCRVLQVGLAVEVPDGSVAGALGGQLIAALPMATLGRTVAVALPPMTPRYAIESAAP